MRDLDLGNWSYTYDANGNLLVQTDARGNKTRFVYDKLNRVKTKIMTGPDSTAPVLSTPYAEEITSTGAVISWTTSEYADSLVESELLQLTEAFC
ncbi:MAG: RHS repeat protein [Candidatus Manganitrophus sp.]|nr:MAG: RHS repeat protein [Candidatus Manganitrophus sp.]